MGIDREDMKVIVAFIPALIAAVAMAFYTTGSTDIPASPPVKIAISIAVGAAIFFAVWLLLDPQPVDDLLEAVFRAGYQQTLTEIDAIRRRVVAAAQTPQIDTGVSECLVGIARMIEMILSRLRDRRRDEFGASSTRLFLHRFDDLLIAYVEIVGRERFIDEATRLERIADFELRVCPMMDAALSELGRQLDSGHYASGEVARGTLEDMLQSLGLLESWANQMESMPQDRGDNP